MAILFSILEHIGIIAFSISGAIVAIDRENDIFGVVFLAFITTFGGGLTRDILLNRMPHFFTHYTSFIITCLITALAVFFFAMIFKKKFIEDEKLLDSINNYIDAIGIGAFAVTGTQLTISLGYTAPLIAIFMGVTTCIGGGMLRDIILNDVPFVLRKRIYAIACILGSGLYYILWYFGVSEIIAMLAGFSTTVGTRVLATIFKWNMPKAINFSEINNK